MALIPGWGFFNGAVAWWMGRRELREIDAGLRTPDGRKKATLGRRFGMVGTLVWGPMLAIGLGAILLSSSTLLEEDFSSSSNTFSTASDEFVDLVVEDGAYIVRMKDVSLPRAVRHFLEAATATVRFEADINQSAQLSIQANQSVGCWNGLSGYLFTLENTGRAGIVEVGSETGGKRTALTEFAVAAAAQPFSEINRMRIDCAGGGTNPTVVTGWLNEEPVASVAVPGGHDSFNAVGFLLTANEPTEFRIDNVLATSALLEPAMAASPPIDGRSAGAVTDSQPDWFAENGVTYVVPAGWQIRLLGESVDGAWRYSVSPDEATDNQMMFAYLPEIVSEEMFGPAAGRIESLLSDEPGSKKVEVAGLEGVRISVDEESTDAVTGEQIRCSARGGRCWTHSRSNRGWAACATRRIPWTIQGRSAKLEG
jgi:hypothetical protein